LTEVMVSVIDEHRKTYGSSRPVGVADRPSTYYAHANRGRGPARLAVGTNATRCYAATSWVSEIPTRLRGRWLRLPPNENRLSAQDLLTQNSERRCGRTV